MDLVERLRSPEPFLAAELRPPKRTGSDASRMDAWLEMGQAIRRLTARDTAVFLTDQTLGTPEEENLQHLIANLTEDVPRGRICPFLTTKHPFEYCMLYAARAVEAGFPALTVLGGDKHAGPPRCVPHGYVLRQHIRQRFPSLALGGWANPLRDPKGQVELLCRDELTAEFFLTQIVSHHDVETVENFVEEAARRGVELPGAFGVFYYRSANRDTLQRLAQFLPVPIEGIARDFDAGLHPDDVCAKTIRTLRELGVTRFYISNLPRTQAAERLQSIWDRVEGYSFT